MNNSKLKRFHPILKPQLYLILGDVGSIHATQMTLVKNSGLSLTKYDYWGTDNFDIFFRKASGPIWRPSRVHHLPIPHQTQAI